jgi:hypothetical protein
LAAIYTKAFVAEYNLAFFHPKKHQCSECTRYSLTNNEDKEQNKASTELHLEHSKEAQTAKATDKERANADPTFQSITFDLQSVLQIP